MLSEDRFQTERRPIFLSEYPDEMEQDVGTGWNLATIASRILKLSILAVTVTAIGIAVLSVGNPVALLANVTDWLDSKPAPQAEAEPSISTAQTIASASDEPAMASAPARSETVAAVELAGASQPEAAGQGQASGQRQAETNQAQAETSQPVSEELFKQFQAWAAEEDTRKQVAAAPPVLPAPARVAQEAPERARPAKRHRRVHSVQNARAELRPQRHYRARVREEQDPRSLAPPAADPRAPDPAAQNAQPPGFLQSLGFRNN